MNKRFTQDKVDAINAWLESEDVSFRYILCEEGFNPHIKIVPIRNKFIDSYIFNLTPKYYACLENFCKEKFDITLSYNNTKNIIWSNEGWDEPIVSNDSDSNDEPTVSNVTNDSDSTEENTDG